jgi:hypothetical protein
MKIKNGKEQEYQDWIDKQGDDGYGLACFSYAETWAELLESNDIKTLTKEKIETLSFEADKEGITGAMFGFAKGILIAAWEYGHLIEYYYTRDDDRKKFLERQLKLERILKD